MNPGDIELESLTENIKSIELLDNNNLIENDRMFTNDQKEEKHDEKTDSTQIMDKLDQTLNTESDNINNCIVIDNDNKICEGENIKYPNVTEMLNKYELMHKFRTENNDNVSVSYVEQYDYAIDSPFNHAAATSII
jgi:hypothetical protein